jgi:hypothetical protein
MAVVRSAQAQPEGAWDAQPGLAKAGPAPTERHFFGVDAGS